MGLFSKMNEKDEQLFSKNERKKWTFSAKMKKKMDLFFKIIEKDEHVQQK